MSLWSARVFRPCWGYGGQLVGEEVSCYSVPLLVKQPTLQVPSLWKCQHDVAVGTFPSPDVIFWVPLLLLCVSCRGFLLPFLSSWPCPCPCCLRLTRQGLAMSHIPHFMGDYAVAYSLHRKEADVRNCVFETTESPLAQLDTHWRLPGCQATGSNKC